MVLTNPILGEVIDGNII